MSRQNFELLWFFKKDVIDIATTGTVSISRWTSKLNKIIDENPGHKEYLLNLKHAAFNSSKKILFVNRGVDISRPLSAQSDCFWWAIKISLKLMRHIIHSIELSEDTNQIKLII